MKLVIAAVLSGLAVINSALAETILPREPNPGQLPPGQIVYVACGPGKARQIIGGKNIGRITASTAPSASRVRGPCVKMN